MGRRTERAATAAAVYGGAGSAFSLFRHSHALRKHEGLCAVRELVPRVHTLCLRLSLAARTSSYLSLKTRAPRVWTAFSRAALCTGFCRCFLVWPSVCRSGACRPNSRSVCACENVVTKDIEVYEVCWASALPRCHCQDFFAPTYLQVCFPTAPFPSMKLSQCQAYHPSELDSKFVAKAWPNARRSNPMGLVT